MTPGLLLSNKLELTTLLFNSRMVCWNDNKLDTEIPKINRIENENNNKITNKRHYFYEEIKYLSQRYKTG